MSPAGNHGAETCDDHLVKGNPQPGLIFGCSAATQFTSPCATLPELRISRLLIPTDPGRLLLAGVRGGPPVALQQQP